MKEISDIRFGTCDGLERPILKGANKWVGRRLDREGLLRRDQISAPEMTAFIRHVSLFYLHIDGADCVTDFHARVLASHVADNIAEITGQSGRESLPPELFDRWRRTAQRLIDTRLSFRTRTQVYGKEYKQGESLIVPVLEHGDLNHALVFTEYWTPATEQPAPFLRVSSGY